MIKFIIFFLHIGFDFMVKMENENLNDAIILICNPTISFSGTEKTIISFYQISATD